MPCLYQNISLEGLSVETKENYVVGDRILLTIELPAEDKIVVVGEIVWSNKNEFAENTYGIRYIDLSPEQLKYLEQMLSHDKLI